jgi:hypothetical protein
MECMYIPMGIKRELVRFSMVLAERNVSGLLEEDQWLFILVEDCSLPHRRHHTGCRWSR